MNMKGQLLKVLHHRQLVDRMYIAKSGEITKRRVKLIHIEENTFKACCFVRNAKRTFSMDHVLAWLLVIEKRGVS